MIKGGDEKLHTVVLKDDQEEKRMSLGEKVFAFSEAGSREIAKEDWKEIALKDRIEAMRIFNALCKNEGVINMEDLKRISAEKVESQENSTISVDDLRDNLHKLPKEEQNKVLSSLEDIKARNEKARREEGFKKLPEDIKMAVGLPVDQLRMLKVDQRTALLEQLDNVLEIETKKHQDQLIAEAIK